MDDIYVVKKGLDVNDRIVLEGMRQVRDGEKVEYEFRQPEVVIAAAEEPGGMSGRPAARNPTSPGTETHQVESEPCSRKSSTGRRWRSSSR